MVFAWEPKIAAFTLNRCGDPGMSVFGFRLGESTVPGGAFGFLWFALIGDFDMDAL